MKYLSKMAQIFTLGFVSPIDIMNAHPQLEFQKSWQKISNLQGLEIGEKIMWKYEENCYANKPTRYINPFINLNICLKIPCIEIENVSQQWLQGIYISQLPYIKLFKNQPPGQAKYLLYLYSALHSDLKYKWYAIFCTQILDNFIHFTLFFC